MPNLCRLTAAMMLLTSLPSYALISSYTATYEIVKYEVRVGTIERVFQRKLDNSYVLTSITKPYGIGKFFTRQHRIQTSAGQISLDRVITFRYQNEEDSEAKSYSLAFESSTHTMVSKQLGRTSQMQYSGDLYDPLSYQLQLRMDMHNPSMDKFDYQVFKKNKTKVLNFVSVSTGTLSTAVGKLNVKVLLRQASGNKKRTKIWVASELDYLPVKIINIEKNGEEISIKLLQIVYNE
jgi:hypothetical protein